MHILKKIKQFVSILQSIDERVDKVQQTLGRIESRQLIHDKAEKFQDFEFQVYSQWGEDGLIQYLIDKIKIERKVFVEFGVANYEESNTRFLLVNNNWSGLIIDGSLDNIDHVKHSSIYWQYNLKTEHAFIDKDNINDLIQQNGISSEIGLLSVDVDGNDYWIWQAINIVNPCIVITEYNSLWGAIASVTTPYGKDFSRTKAHHSNLYYGASIQALTDLGKTKGYSLVGSNSAGNNLFFVRNDLLGDLEVVSPETAWVQSQFREARDANGNLSFAEFNKRLELVAEMTLVNVKDNKEYKVRDVCGK